MVAKQTSATLFFKLCGRPDGREDHDILRYAVETESIAKCFTGDIPLTLLLGMKGVGKSTAFKNMVSVPRERFLVAGFAPGSERFQRLSNVQPGLFRERFYALFLIAALALVDESGELSGTDKKGISAALGPLKSILKQASKTAKTGASRIKGGSAFGFGLSFDLSQDEEKKFDKFDRSAAEEKLHTLADKDVFIRMFVDDPEQSLPPGEQGRSSLIGLVLAANEININFEGLVGVTVMLKTHVYHAIADNEELANMLPSQRGVLSWTADELSRAINRRLEFAKSSYNDAFSIKPAELASKVIATLRNGPRDLFAWIALAGAESPHKKVSWENFSATNKELGQYSLQQISTAYADTVPNISRLFQLIFAKDMEMGWETLIERIAEMRTNNSEFIELDSKNKLEQSSDYAKLFLQAGAFQIVTSKGVIEPFAKEYHDVREVGRGAKVKLHPLLASAVLS